MWNVHKRFKHAIRRGVPHEVSNLTFDHGVNVKDSFGNTPLHLAATFGTCQLIEILLQHGAVVNSTNNMGETPLHCAARAGRGCILMVLLQAGARENWRTRKGCTAANLAVNRNHRLVAAFLSQYAEQGPSALQASKIKRCHRHRSQQQPSRKHRPNHPDSVRGEGGGDGRGEKDTKSVAWSAPCLSVPPDQQGNYDVFRQMGFGDRQCVRAVTERHDFDSQLDFLLSVVAETSVSPEPAPAPQTSESSVSTINRNSSSSSSSSTCRSSSTGTSSAIPDNGQMESDQTIQQQQVQTLQKDLETATAENERMKIECAEKTSEVEKLKEKLQLKSEESEGLAAELTCAKRAVPTQAVIETMSLTEVDQFLTQLSTTLSLAVAHRKKRESEHRVCCICMEQPKDSVFVPCGHRAVCSGCGEKVSVCPICRVAIGQIVKCFD